MDADKIKEIVKTAVDDSLSKKERASALADMEAIITEAKTSIDELTGTVADKSALVEEKELALATLDGEKSALEVTFTEKAEALDAALATVENLEADVAAKTATIEDAEASFVELQAKFDEMFNKVQAAELASRLQGRVAKLEEAGILRTSETASEKQSADVNDMSDEDFDAYVAEMVALKEEFSVEVRPVVPEVAALNLETIRVDIEDKYKKLGEALTKQ